MCDCLQLTIQTNLVEQTIQSNAIGQYNGKNYYSFTYDIYTFIVWFDSGSLRWTVSDILGNPVPTYFVMNPIGGVPKECPTGVLGTVNGTWIDGGHVDGIRFHTGNMVTLCRSVTKRHGENTFFESVSAKNSILGIAQRSAGYHGTNEVHRCISPLGHGAWGVVCFQ
jgi:hypothetical protein